MKKLLWLFVWTLLGPLTLPAQQFQNGDFEIVVCPDDCTPVTSSIDCIERWFEGRILGDSPLEKTFCFNDVVCTGDYSMRLWTTSDSRAIIPQTINPYHDFDFEGVPGLMRMTMHVVSGTDNTGVHVGGTDRPPATGSSIATPLAFASAGTTGECKQVSMIMPTTARDFEYLVFRTAGPSGSHIGGFTTIMDDVQACGPLLRVAEDCGRITVSQSRGCELRTLFTDVSIANAADPDNDLAFFETDDLGPFTFEVEEVGTYLIKVLILDENLESYEFQFEQEVTRVATPSVAISGITNRNCVLHDFEIDGTYNLCDPTDVSSIVLEFYRNGNYTGVSIPVTVNNDGTWTYSGIMSTVVADFGLNFGTWYDIIPVMTSSSGTVTRGTEFTLGTSNDLQFADRSDPLVTVNSTQNNPTFRQSTFCADAQIFYHGFDPLTTNHFSAISRRPIGTSGNFGEPRAIGWVDAPLESYTGNLRTLYPGYIKAGFEYQVFVATSSSANCIAWSPTTTVFQVIDCCAPEATIGFVPECIGQDQEFVISVIVNAPLSGADIERIYSNNADYTYRSHLSFQSGDQLVLLITFVSNTCSCAGSPLLLDIVLLGCNETIWIMTDEPIPCCLESCEDVSLEAWESGECIVVNGQVAREFSLLVSSESDLLSVSAYDNDATCQITPTNLQITNNGNGTSTITGIMLFDSPDCTSNALLTLQVGTEEGCCVLSRPFSFPDACEIPPECLPAEPQPQLLSLGDLPSLSFSINAPKGSLVTIVDPQNNATYQRTVGIIECAPWMLGPNGEVIGLSECNGFTIPAPGNINCNRVDGETPNLPYRYEISYSECVAIVVGNYCDLTRSIPFDGFDPGGGGLPGGLSSEAPALLRSDATANSASAPTLSVYPNPLRGTDLLHVEVKDLSSPIQSLYLADASGKTVAVIPVPEERARFQHQLEQKLNGGLYLVVMQLADGSRQVHRLIAID